jgi:L-lactate dehydrogenase (cytochrome)
VPDVVHAKDGKKGSKGKSVSIKDVLAHKEGDEVWVVIKGDVYKCVFDLWSSHGLDIAGKRLMVV